MNTNTLMSDFQDLKNITYKDYSLIKGYTFLNLENIGENSIKKVLNTLTINEVEFNLDGCSINDLIDILFSNIPDLEIYFYEDQPESYLNSSALFLADFNTDIAVRFYITDEIVKSDLIENYKDFEGNDFKLKDLKVFSEFNEELPYYKRKTSYRMTVKNSRLTLVCSYSALNMKIMYLQEYPISSVNQISNMSSEGSIDLWS